MALTHPAPDSSTPHDKAYLRRLLSARNQAPDSAPSIDAAIEQALERDNFMTADAAKEFGLIDEVLMKRPEPAPQA